MPSKKDTGLRITDVKVVGGGLSAEICGSPIPGAPKRKSCIAMLSSVDYAWLEGQDAADHYRIAEDAQSVEWPALNRIISVHEILDHSWIIYFWKWSLNRISEDIDVDAIIGCWRRNGFILLHESGMVLMKLVGKGPASDLGGDWKWEKVSRNQFVVTRRDVDGSEELVGRQEYTPAVSTAVLSTSTFWSFLHEFLQLGTYAGHIKNGMVVSVRRASRQRRIRRPSRARRLGRFGLRHGSRCAMLDVPASIGSQLEHPAGRA